MVRRRKRRDQASPARDDVDLEAPEHAWWAAGSTDPFARDEEPAPEPPPAAPDPEPVPDADVDDRDPYEVLRLAHTATWDEIVASHRKLVRWWHPDGLADGADEAEREFCAARMREVNDAYQALRVRRGR